MMKYLPHTDRDREAMLKTIGVKSVDELFSDIPAQVRFNRALDLPRPLSDPELARHMGELASRNRSLDGLTCFLGGGVYDHFVPSVVEHIVSRSEFYTAYTPYQAEASQGVLQSIYEYQTLICELTGMDVSQASMYDGASAAAEAGLICAATLGRGRIVVPASLHPEYRQTIKTYAWAHDLEVAEVPFGPQGTADLSRLEAALGPEPACLIVQHPNFFGALEPVEEMGRLVHARGGLLVAACDPISLGVLKPPAAYGADIALGEGQPLGIRLSFGGPYLGFFATSEKLVRRMPGRIAGATLDHQGRRGFVLALQTREQHIRREKATSNICSNEALCALAATVYLCALGRRGIVKLAGLCLQKAHYARDQVARLERFKPAFDAPFFREFAVRSTLPWERVESGLLQQGQAVGPSLGRFYPELKDCFLLAFTEKRTREEIDYLVGRMEGLI
ncbi:MAG: aminomethyl-transferring glycine dehydrogenase subunit GcvPA [Acetobacteraceae bacterium]|nr:aminomethyl-transferring glycine dehydrogenase subunit GcvPA [Acetobacteraceae bacterium]